MAEYLAAGLDPDKSTIFVQSDVPEIPELYLLLNMHVGIGELMRTAAFKDKARKQLGITVSHDDDDNDVAREIIGNESNKRVNAGLLTYPTLMAVSYNMPTLCLWARTRNNTWNSLDASHADSTRSMALIILRSHRTSISEESP